MRMEANFDLFIRDLLKESEVDADYQGSENLQINEALKTASKNMTGKTGFPEFVAVINDFVLIIEDKKDIDKLEIKEDDELLLDKDSIREYAVNGALHYGKHILEKTVFNKAFVIGAAGDEKHHKIKPYYIEENLIKELPEIDTFENFNENNINNYYREQVLGEESQEEKNLSFVLKFASKLHEDLRNYGALAEQEKPLIVSGILLALREKEKGNFSLESLTGDQVKTDGQKIFEAVESNLRGSNIPEEKRNMMLYQFEFMKDRPKLNNKANKLLGITPLKYFASKIDQDIYRLITENTPEDYLGRFYGEFVSYTGGDGQNLGIVLTPRHITELMNELIDVSSDDIIFDPCCGTGGFLIAGMTKMLNMTDSEKQREQIKKNQIHGIEEREDMFSIASTNMILRGDGKSNVICADFLNYPISNLKEKHFTKGLMNPPYSLSKNKDTWHLSEITFTQRLLDSMKTGGKVAVIVPVSTMVGKNSHDRKIKKQILEKHTLEGVITLNTDTFYGIGVDPCIAIFKTGEPHNPRKLTKFINFKDDGYVVKKHSGLIKTEKAKDRKKYLLDAWRDYQRNLPTSFMVESTVKPDDEWLHSFYYFNDEIPKEDDFIKTINDYLTFEFSMIAQGKSYLFEGEKDVYTE